MPDRYVLDTHAVLALLDGEAAAQRVFDVLADEEPWMTLVNLGEVAYITERRDGKAAADIVYAELLSEERGGAVPIRWLDVDRNLVRQAASLKALGGISYADCFAAAAASILDCPVLTGDPEYAVAERAGIAVIWL